MEISKLCSPWSLGRSSGSRLFKFFAVSLVIASVLGTSGCSSARKRPAPGTEGSQELGPPQPYGPEVTAHPTESEYGPSFNKSRPVVLVFGPGLARGFSYAGVIKGLREANVQIGAIVATEMGALVASLYGFSQSVNDFEWMLQKFKEKSFTDRSLFRDHSGESNGKRLYETLESVIGKKDMKESRIPVKILVLKPDLGMIQEGNAAQSVRSAMSVPGFFSAYNWGSQTMTSSAMVRPFPISEAKLLGLGPVIVVDVMGASDPATQASSEQRATLLRMIEVVRSAQGELKDADLLLEPDMNGIGYLDFGKRTEAIFRGKAAVTSKLPEIKQLIGGSGPS
ncbi:patatin-like phospholipase family protein [bacterium]|nr:patatin-like phospholipase family protein [bacterium]